MIFRLVLILTVLTIAKSADGQDYSTDFLINKSESKRIGVFVSVDGPGDGCPGRDFWYDRAAEGAILRAGVNTFDMQDPERGGLVMQVQVTCIPCRTTAGRDFGVAYHVIAVFTRFHLGIDGRIVQLGDLGNGKVMSGMAGKPDAPDTGDQLRRAVSIAVEEAMTDYLKANIDR